MIATVSPVSCIRIAVHENLSSLEPGNGRTIQMKAIAMVSFTLLLFPLEEQINQLKIFGSNFPSKLARLIY